MQLTLPKQRRMTNVFRKQLPVKQVTEVGIFSIMMDETTDAGKVEQASIVIRFVDITLSY